MPSKSSFGEAVEFTLFGESHSEAIGIVINGLAPGIPLDLDYMRRQLVRRSARGRISTQRREPDEPRILSGFWNGFTTGTPLCLLIENTNTRSGDYARLRACPRPSHADFTAEEKYFGYQDHRGGGHFSGRLTAPLVAAGAICQQILLQRGIRIASHIRSLGEWEDQPFSQLPDRLSAQAAQLEQLAGQGGFPTLDPAAGSRMTEAIEAAAAAGDSLGGRVETVILGMEPGIGEPFFSSVESRLSQLLFSIPAVKGVEFGAGFSITRMPGSRANDAFTMQDGSVRTRTNHNGGLNGGISNGMPVCFTTAVKPTPSIYLPQQTVDLSRGEDTTLQIEGRHDPAVIHRAVPVIDAVSAMALVDLYSERYGYLWQNPSFPQVRCSHAPLRTDR